MYTKANAAVLAALAVPAQVDDSLITEPPLNKEELLELTRLDVRSATTDVNIAGETIRTWVTTLDGQRSIEVKEHGTSLEVDVTILGEAEAALEAFVTDYDWATRFGELSYAGKYKLTPKQVYLALAEAALRGYISEDGEILDLQEQKMVPLIFCCSCAIFRWKIFTPCSWGRHLRFCMRPVKRLIRAAVN